MGAAKVNSYYWNTAFREKGNSLNPPRSKGCLNPFNRKFSSRKLTFCSWGVFHCTQGAAKPSQSGILVEHLHIKHSRSGTPRITQPGSSANRSGLVQQQSCHWGGERHLNSAHAVVKPFKYSYLLVMFVALAQAQAEVGGCPHSSFKFTLALEAFQIHIV